MDVTVKQPHVDLELCIAAAYVKQSALSGQSSDLRNQYRGVAVNNKSSPFIGVKENHRK